MPSIAVTEVIPGEAVYTIHKINSREGCDHMPKCPISMIVFVAKGEREATKREENHQHWNNMYVFR